MQRPLPTTTVIPIHVIRSGNSEKNKYTLLYLYEIHPGYKPAIDNAWNDIEKYAIMKKENDLLIQLIEKLKHSTFIKYY